MKNRDLKNKDMKSKGIKRKKMTAALLCGLAGCICMCAGDWLMLYGDTAYSGSVSWLTEGASGIAPWRNSLAMLLAFPGIILYGIALFYIERFLSDERQKKRYHYLTAFGLTPWLCLHLFYIMILYVFAWMRTNGYEAAALPAAEALFGHLSWIVILSEAMMLPPFIYWFYLLIRGRSVFPRWMALSNPLIFYGILKAITGLMPDCAFRLGFTNGLMSESMFIWFTVMIVWGLSAPLTQDN
ncbi:MAG: hypothetical protein Q4C61_04230 [Lachnospiraceae bacterium]|nr:hypothetical protein [Lachnospiraceae bacterium]